MVVTHTLVTRFWYETSGHYAKYGADSFQPIKTPRERRGILLKPMIIRTTVRSLDTNQGLIKELPLRIGIWYRLSLRTNRQLYGLSREEALPGRCPYLLHPGPGERRIPQCVGTHHQGDQKNGLRQLHCTDITQRPNTPDKYIGSDENWNATEHAIISATRGRSFITTTAYGETAFYGPKLDFYD